MGIDKKNRYVNLSIKALQIGLGEDTSVHAHFGDLLKEQMDEARENEESE